MGVKIRQLELVGRADLAPVGSEAGRLFDVTKVNLIVGPNNVGKSRLLRDMFARPSLIYRPSGIDVDSLNNLIDQFRREIRDTIGNAHVVDFAQLIQRTGRLRHISVWSTDEDPLDAVIPVIQAASKATMNDSVQHGAGLPLMSIGELAAHVQAVGRRYEAARKRLTKHYQPPDFARVYVPALRGARVLSDQTDFYAERTAADYFPPAVNILDSGKLSLFTGQNLYATFRSMALGDEEKRNAYVEFARLLSLCFFREKVTVVPREDERTLHVRIGNRPDRPIHALGDGIQQLIIILFALFFYRTRDLLLFVEEPELFLHPSLQRSLLSVFAGREFPRTQVFASTHSNHLLDRTVASDAVSVFLLMRDPARDESSRIVAPERDSHAALDALGAVQSSLLLTNCTIWVEGITDRMYLRKWFELAASEEERFVSVIEDVHYSFFEYAGSNLEHWQELESTDAWINVKPICPRMIVIADADLGKNRKHERLTQRLGMRYHVIEGLEIENLLSDTVVQKVVAGYERSTANLRRPPAGLRLKKHIGDYIDEDILIDATRSARYRASGKRRRYSGVAYVYATPSGTIKGKMEFARRAVDATTSYRLVSREAKKLVKLIHDFIVESNAHALRRDGSQLLD